MAGGKGGISKYIYQNIIRFVMKIKSVLLVIAIIAAVSLTTYAQEEEALQMKQDALQLMQKGRYGEAIDLLNNYVAAFPRNADGYNLRGLCFEKRNEFENSVYNFRLARKLEPNNNEISANLQRATDKWYDVLRKKIKGHEREIAIDPSKAINYLEIGKSYKRLGNWAMAEVWYDKYIALEDPSSDEVIRYTEILQHTGSLEKGRKILKKYCERFPKDHRLWSRYGYFSYWLGDRTTAKTAFENALALRPYFKEAQDGLDLVLGKGYLYTYHDTTSQNYGRGGKQTPKFVYAIDKYYKILDKNPNDKDTRYKLIEELYNAERYEEAHQQLDILKPADEGQDRYEEWRAKVDQIRKEILEQRIAQLKQNIENDPSDGKSVLELARYYNSVSKYGEALMLFENYFEMNPDDNDPEIRYEYARTAAQNQDFYSALEQMDYVLEAKPDNMKYQLFYALLLVWVNEDLDVAEDKMLKVIDNEPDNIEAIIGYASLLIKQNRFEEADIQLKKLKKLDADHPEISTLESNFETRKLRYREEQLYASLEEARDLYKEGKCREAVDIYQNYIDQYEPSRTIKKDFADLNYCAGNYNKAMQLYDELLAEEFDPVVELGRAHCFYQLGQYHKAIEVYEGLMEDGYGDFNVRLLHADAHIKTEEYDRAEDLYEEMLMETDDPEEQKILRQRIEWIPPTGLEAFFGSFPSYVLIAPFGSYFSDNADYGLLQFGLQAEVGIGQYLSFNAGYTRGRLEAGVENQDFNHFKLGLNGKYKDYFTAGFTIGSLRYPAHDLDITTYDAFIARTVDSVYGIQGNFSRQDAATLLYSATLVNWGLNNDGYSRLTTDMYMLSGWYRLPSGFELRGKLMYIDIDDGNKGSNLELKIGKWFLPELIAGYEYATSVYSRFSNLYYSPKDFESHSLWGEWTLYQDDHWKLGLDGKLGIIPENDFLLKQIVGKISYSPVSNFTISAMAAGGNSVRDEIGYSSQSFSLNIFWTL